MYLVELPLGIPAKEMTSYTKRCVVLAPKREESGYTVRGAMDCAYDTTRFYMGC